MRRSIPGLCSILVALGLLLLPLAPRVGAEGTAVVIEDFDFAPATINITAGTTVTWTNHGPTIHSATSDNGVWDSGLLKVGQSFSLRFDTPGSYNYHCTPHPFMQATINVAAAAAPVQPTEMNPHPAQPPPASSASDYDIANGHFFKQANGQGGAGSTGYGVVDDGQARFWSEFKRLGGVASVGYPASQRFQLDGFTVQVFQKVVFQWRPEVNQVYFVNILDKLHDAGKDPFLLSTRQTPPPEDTTADTGLPFPAVVARHQAFLDSNAAIKAAYFADSDPLNHFGLPMTHASDQGPLIVIRTQRAVFQQWKVATSFAQPGQVLIANGGDIAKESGIFPAAALLPEAGS